MRRKLSLIAWALVLLPVIVAAFAVRNGWTP